MSILDAALARSTAPGGINPNQFYSSWWRQALTEPGQLRQRVAFAYSQIFVVSLNDPTLGNGPPAIRGVGSYYDMLLENAFGNYRELLDDITMHAAMGVYLTYMSNRAEDPAGSRTPDENYAREVLQLMSIGLFELNLDGTLRTDSNGRPIPTYTQSDISNLAKVFTGMGWWHPNPNNNTFAGSNRQNDAFIRPLLFYPQFHSTSAKTFLGTTIPATSSATAASMGSEIDIALDTIFQHPNVGPFIATRLIQQLVTSNPSPAYVERVARVFNDNGSGVRGDMGAVVRAILLDPEARDMTNASAAAFGKLREPVIRMANLLRGFNARSASGYWLIQNTSSSQSLGQSPMASPSVFNFWRPGFVPPATTEAGSRNLRAPEFQAVDEVSVAGYVNTVFTALTNGLGAPTSGSPDVRLDLAREIAMADDANALVEHINRLLFYGAMPSSLRSRLVEAVSSISIPANGSAAQIEAARLARVQTALLLSMSAPDYLIQR